MGLEGVIISIYFTFIFASLVVIMGFILGKIKTRQPIPLAPFLSLGALLAWIFGNSFWINASENIINLIL